MGVLLAENSGGPEFDLRGHVTLRNKRKITNYFNGKKTTTPVRYTTYLVAGFDLFPSLDQR